MVSPVSRIPPPPLLDLELPSAPLLDEPERRGVHDNAKEKFLCPTAGGKRVVGQSHTKSYNASALQRLVDLLQKVHTEMEDDVARIKLAIGETQEDIRLLRAERHDRAGDENAKPVPKTENVKQGMSL